MITRSKVGTKKNHILTDQERNSSVVAMKKRANDRKTKGLKKQKIKVTPLDEIALLNKRNKARLSQLENESLATIAKSIASLERYIEDDCTCPDCTNSDGEYNSSSGDEREIVA